EAPLAPLFVRRGHPEHQRVRRPWCGRGAGLRGARHDLELVDVFGALTVRGAQAVGTGVTATDDDDLLALGGDGRLAVLAENIVALLNPVAPRQVFHRLMD